MHLAITFLVMLAVLAVVFVPGYAIQRGRRRRAERPASYSFEPAPAIDEPDPLPPHLLAALRVEGFLSEDEMREAAQREDTHHDLEKVTSDLLLQVRGVTDSAIEQLVSGGKYVQLRKPEV